MKISFASVGAAGLLSVSLVGGLSSTQPGDAAASPLASSRLISVGNTQAINSSVAAAAPKVAAVSRPFGDARGVQAAAANAPTNWYGCKGLLSTGSGKF